MSLANKFIEFISKAEYGKFNNCMIHSLGIVTYAYRIAYINKNDFCFMTQDGYFAHAIYNPFTNLYYVDDVYGLIPFEKAYEYYTEDNNND